MITEEIKTLLRAIADGKKVQIKDKIRSDWEDTSDYMALTIITNTVSAAGSFFDVRIKPEPLECWVNVYEDGILATRTKEEAIGSEYAQPIRRAVHMREVI